MKLRSHTSTSKLYYCAVTLQSISLLLLRSHSSVNLTATSTQSLYVKLLLLLLQLLLYSSDSLRTSQLSLLCLSRLRQSIGAASRPRSTVRAAPAREYAPMVTSSLPAVTSAAHFYGRHAHTQPSDLGWCLLYSHQSVSVNFKQEETLIINIHWSSGLLSNYLLVKLINISSIKFNLFTSALPFICP